MDRIFRFFPSKRKVFHVREKLSATLGATRSRSATFLHDIAFGLGRPVRASRRAQPDAAHRPRIPRRNVSGTTRWKVKNLFEPNVRELYARGICMLNRIKFSRQFLGPRRPTYFNSMRNGREKIQSGRGKAGMEKPTGNPRNGCGARRERRRIPRNGQSRVLAVAGTSVPLFFIYSSTERASERNAPRLKTFPMKILSKRTGDLVRSAVTIIG